MANFIKKHKRKLLAAAALLFWTGVWAVAALITGQSLILPGPAETLKRLCELASGTVFWKTVLFSFGRILLGTAAGTAAGIDACLHLVRRELPYDTELAFVVQEEVGLRGAGVAAREIDPDIAVVFEATTAADIPGSEGADRVCLLGGGAVISLIDGRTVYDKQLYDLAVLVCEAQGIPHQTKTKIAGGNDAGAIQNAGRGARVMAVSVPCRYLHAPVSVIRLSDAEACESLAYALVSALQEAEV